MSYIRRTLSYMKRNGPVSTFWAVAERKDKTGMDAWQRRTLKYPHKVSPSSLIGERKDKPEEFSKEEGMCVSILVPAYETDVVFFKQMVESVLGQTYRNWQLVIADASADEDLGQIAASYNDDRIEYVHLSLNEGISDNTNAAFEHARGEYTGFLDHDDILAPEALSEVMKLAAVQGCDIIYTDEDKVNEELTFLFEPNVKPKFNLDLLLTNNYICHFTVIKTGLFKKLRLRHEFDGAQDYDLMLRAVTGIEWIRTELIADDDIRELPYGFFPADYFRSRIGHVPRILYHWRAGQNSTADNPDAKRYAYEAGKRALKDFYDQLEWDTEVLHTSHLGFYETRYIPDIFSVRKDIWGICGRAVLHGRVAEGPVLGGIKLFEGMNYHYSGYLHRASLYMDVDKAAEYLIKERNAAKKAGSFEKKHGRLLYDPKLLIRSGKR